MPPAKKKNTILLPLPSPLEPAVVDPIVHIKKAKNGRRKKKNRISGGHVRAWREQAGFPNAADDVIVQEVNRIAASEGYEWQCTAEDVARWRKNLGFSKQRGQSRRRPDTSGEPEAIRSLRELVKYIGKNAVHTIVDNL